MSDTHRRPHLWTGSPKLAELPLERPLDRAGVPEVEVQRTRTAPGIAHDASIETWSPILAGGLRPARPGVVLAPGLVSEAIADAGEARRVGFEWDGSTARAQVSWEPGTSAYGLGEQVGPLLRNGRTHLLWNTDAWRYGEETPALYQSHPWVLAVRPDGSALGILADSPRRGLVTVADDGVELAFEAEPFDVHLVEAAHPAEVLRALAALVGAPARPPRWALGYHQCRWSYGTEEEVRRVAARMRAERVPCDAIWFDIDYMDRRRVFTWDRAAFPDPQALIDDLAAEDYHAVAILDPGVAVAEDCELHASGLAGRHFVEDANGEPVAGRVWPGLCHFPDFTRASTRAWWADKVRDFVEDWGFDGLWCDMNEPAVFRTPGRTLPDDAVHRGLGGGEHARFHNLYGQLMAEATRRGLAAARPGKRPFVLTRAGHLGAARHAATWTGDNQSRWEDLRWSIPMVLNLGLSGQPMSGPDLGGFTGAPDAELFERWYELGAWLPFCRGHADKESPRQEPWAFGHEVLTRVRASLEGRMRRLTIWTTLFEEAARTGIPPCRPLFFADPADAGLRAVDDAFLVGEDLLVAPALEAGRRRRRVVLPRHAGGWFPFHADGARVTGREVEFAAPLGTCPVLARAGALVVEGATRRHTREPDVERAWHVFLDDDGRAAGRVFEESSDETLARTIHAELEGGKLLFRVESEGALRQPEERRSVRVHGLPGGGVLEAEAPLGSEFTLPLA